jgi:putative hydrolase of the HAD superfamily
MAKMTAVLALDAMGVLYAARDDVAELLIPFARRSGSPASDEEIEREYLAASLGNIDAPTFWTRLGLDPLLEDEYLSEHRLMPGVLDLLAGAKIKFRKVCCLSNDVPQWSIKLRRLFGIEAAIGPWIVSGDVSHRKPSLAIYQHLLGALKLPAHKVVFVDDRLKNLDAAQRLGMHAVLFDPQDAATGTAHTRISRLPDLLDLTF